ncbi:MAG: cation:proton antiporter [Fimbriimonas sp.]
MTDLDLMLRFMLQVLVVLGACKAIGWLGSRFLGQTQVVMEMVTGVILGPSLFGLLTPELQQSLFPKDATMIVDGVTKTVKHPSMMILYVVAQIGLVLYMFLVGLEFNLSLLGKKAGGAIAVSLAGIAAPFILGAIIAVAMLQSTEFFAPNISVPNMALYTGAAMCITAFPMLARIIYERGISNTRLGTLALGAGASDDATAWCLLAIVLAFSKGSANYAIFAIGGGALFAVLVLKLGPKLFAPMGAQVEREGTMSQSVFVSILLFLMLGAYITDAIGIYAVFGAFLIGAAMPRGRFAEILREKLEALTVGLFLPFFFVYSGLNTKLGLVNTPALWMITLVILIAAIVGKGVACALAAKASGETWRDAWTIGTLMNARGLMELIILNIGLQQGVITPTLFTILVIMAIVTTLMASPIFQRIYRPTEAVPAGALA